MSARQEELFKLKEDLKNNQINFEIQLKEKNLVIENLNDEISNKKQKVWLNIFEEIQ